MDNRKRLKRSAIGISFAAPAGYCVIMLLVFTIKLPAGLGTGLFWSPFAIIFSFLAIYKPLAAGIMMVISGGLLFSCSLITNHYLMYYLPISSIQIIAGILHLIRSAK